MNRLDLKPEEKSGYFVSTEMKKVWQVELDILEQIINICKKYNIKYVSNGGTTIGSVRHKGFIPWDDDIDLMMKREDYNSFLEVAPLELKEPYFLQYYKTEEKYYRGHIQVRDSSTTAIIEEDKYNNYNKGIWVDIFPLDNIPDDLKEREKFTKKIAQKKKLISYSLLYQSPNLFKKIIKFFISKVYWKIFKIEKAIMNLEKLAQKYNDVDTKICTIVILGSKVEYENEWFKEVVEKDFEYLKIATVKDYDRYLSKVYGDYMKIPEIKPGSVHGEVFFNTEKSYKDFSKEEILEITEKLNFKGE